jgi:diguanylate cyclase (GGDEF)-like protein
MIDHCIKDIFSLESRLKFDAILQYQVNLAERFEDDAPFCVLICALDNYNNYDEATQNKLMKTFGNFLLNNTRKSDVMAKLSHNKFIILAPHSNYSEGLEFARKLQFNLNSENVDIHSSICVGEFVDINVTKEDFITQINSKLNSSKDTHTVVCINQ